MGRTCDLRRVTHTCLLHIAQGAGGFGAKGSRRAPCLLGPLPRRKPVRMATVLIVEDEAVLARNLAKYFTRQNFQVVHAGTTAEARRLVSGTPPDVVLLDLRLPDGSGLDLLDALLAADPELPVIMMTAYRSVPDAVPAMQRGARDYVQKPLDLNEIGLKVEHALRSIRHRRELSYYRERQAAAARIDGESEAVQRLRSLVDRLT